MAKETKTVQCYPSDDKINAMVERYASFGWELINNQRCQEFTGQTFDSDGSSTSHYSTFNKLTFTREKTSSWYSQVTELEDRYNSLMNQKSDGHIGRAVQKNRLHLLFLLWLSERWRSLSVWAWAAD